MLFPCASLIVKFPQTPLVVGMGALVLWRSTPGWTLLVGTCLTRLWFHPLGDIWHKKNSVWPRPTAWVFYIILGCFSKFSRAHFCVCTSQAVWWDAKHDCPGFAWAQEIGDSTVTHVPEVPTAHSPPPHTWLCSRCDCWVPVSDPGSVVTLLIMGHLSLLSFSCSLILRFQVSPPVAPLAGWPHAPRFSPWGTCPFPLLMSWALQNCRRICSQRKTGGGPALPHMFQLHLLMTLAESCSSQFFLRHRTRWSSWVLQTKTGTGNQAPFPGYFSFSLLFLTCCSFSSRTSYLNPSLQRPFWLANDSFQPTYIVVFNPKQGCKIRKKQCTNSRKGIIWSNLRPW